MSVRTGFLLSVAFTIFTIFSRVRSSDTNFFVNPPISGPAEDYTDDVSFTIDSVVDFAWVTDYPKVSLQLCQQNPDESASCFTMFQNQLTVTAFQWTVNLAGSGFQLTYSQTFYLQVYNGPIGSDDSFTCHYFDILENGQATTMSVVTATMNPFAVAGSSSANPALSTVTITPDITYRAPIQSGKSGTPSTSTSSTTSRTKTRPTSSSTTKLEQDRGISEGAKVGIGVGVGVGVPCLAIGGLLAFCMRRRRRPSEPREHPNQTRWYKTGSRPPQPREDLSQTRWYQTRSGHNPDERNRAFSTQYGPGLGSGRSVRELPAQERAQELYAGRIPMQELPASNKFRR